MPPRSRPSTRRRRRPSRSNRPANPCAYWPSCSAKAGCSISYSKTSPPILTTRSAPLSATSTRKAKRAIQEHLVLEAVLNQSEGATVDVPSGFDPSAIRLTGNVTGSPPFKGSLEHHGWRVTKIKLNKPAEGQDAFVLQPAEVELS